MIFKYGLLLQFMVISSWKLNNNKCIITQLEDYFFAENIINYYYKYVKGKKLIKNTYKVPILHRYLLYVVFVFLLLINLFK